MSCTSASNQQHPEPASSQSTRITTTSFPTYSPPTKTESSRLPRDKHERHRGGVSIEGIQVLVAVCVGLLRFLWRWSLRPPFRRHAPARRELGLTPRTRLGVFQRSGDSRMPTSPEKRDTASLPLGHAERTSSAASPSPAAARGSLLDEHAGEEVGGLCSLVPEDGSLRVHPYVVLRRSALWPRCVLLRCSETDVALTYHRCSVAAVV
jgi:hypothetical protein